MAYRAVGFYHLPMHDADRATLRVDVLGSLRICVGDVVRTPTAAKQRNVLAMLALGAGEIVSAAELRRELWGEAAPRTARTTLHVYISQLRRLFATAMRESAATVTDPKDVIVTQPGGYRLNGDLVRVDAHEFETLAAAGHRARAVDDYAAAAEHFGEALALWRGRTLVDLTPGPVLRVQVDRLEAGRRSVLDRRIDADLRIGRHYELLGELAGLVTRYGTHEGLHLQLMVALSRAGRRDEAMRVYRTLHRRLANVGLRPSIRARGIVHDLLLSAASGGEGNRNRLTTQ